MTLPVMPSTHRWFRGGPGLSKVGRNALFADDSTRVWVWDEETGDPVTDLLDENGNRISAPKVVDGWVLGAGLPVSVRVASFSLGRDGKRYELASVRSVVDAADAAANASSSAAAAQSAADSAAASANLVGAPAGAAIDAGAGNAKIVYVSPSGNDSASGKAWGSAKATMGAALAVIGTGNPGAIVLDFGTHDVGNGLSLSGHKVSIIGRGVGHGTTNPERCVIKASTQTGPVLDFTGYVWPDSFRGRVEFGNFAIQGSNVADATKNNAGMRVATPSAASGSAYFHDIAISQTGGPCLDLGACYLSDFDRITLVTPVSAKANDVPYMRAVGANGNRFRGIGLRSMSSSADVGVSGAIVLAPGGGYAPHDNIFDAPWFENLHVPTNGCLLSIAGNSNVVQNPQIFDCAKETGATGTAHARFLVPTGSGVVDLGGNMWRGYVPGKGTSAVSIDVGIDIRQNRNSIIGTKGYRGTNVQLAAGVVDNFIQLVGGESNATDAAVVDNSGNVGNVYLDYYSGVHSHRNYSQVSKTVGNGGAGPQFYDSATPASGAVWLGNAGTRLTQTAAAGATLNSDVVTFMDQTKTAGKAIKLDLSFRPGITFPDHGALPAASSGLRGKVVVVQGAAGVADQIYVCRKNASDAYEWAPLA